MVLRPCLYTTHEDILKDAHVEPIAMAFKKTKVGMVRAFEKKRCNRKHQSSCRNEDRGRPS